VGGTVVGSAAVDGRLTYLFVLGSANGCVKSFMLKKIKQDIIIA